MNLTHLRIFIIPSHICATYATIFASNTKEQHYKDILLLDASRRRNSLAQLIGEVATLHDWALIHDFSLLNEASDYRPTLRKSITRKIKTWPGIRAFYRLLYNRYMKKMNAGYIARLNELLNPYASKAAGIEIFALTETYLNTPLHQLYPQAKISYLEHGIGDYYYLLNKRKPGDTFYCVFAAEYRAYYSKINPDTSWIKSIPGIETFRDTAAELLKIHRPEFPEEISGNRDKPVVLILLEAVDMYNVPDSFWTAYADHVLAQLEKPGKNHYILKPHPMQSKESILRTEAHFLKLGYSCFVASQDSLTSFSIEILFSRLKDRVRHVFCLSSSGCFYLSEFYPDPQIKYWYSTEFMSRYIHTAPPQYYKLYLEIRPMIEEVFATKCTAY